MASVGVRTAGRTPAGGPLYKAVLMRAWLYTGPLGHLAAGVIDWVALLVRYVRTR
jgi:hypothetical protein